MRDRAEGRPPEPLIVESLEILVLMIAMTQFALATWAVFRDPSYRRTWLIAFISGCVLLFVFYAHAWLWIEAVLVSGSIATLVHTSDA